MDGLKAALLAPAAQSEPDLEGLSRRARQGDMEALPALGRQFEALFLSQLLKEMRQTLEPDGLFGKDGGDVLGGLFDLQMGQHLARAGGLGLGAVIQRQLEPQQNQETEHPATAPCEKTMRICRPFA